MFRSWEKIPIRTDSGVDATAVVPIVISASRATDIPAFHGRWLMNRLKRGYVKWVNPYSGKEQYVSFSKTRVIVFWTKNPEPFLSFLPEIDMMGFHYYFLFTLNDYEDEGFEPGVPPLLDRVNTFKRLSGKIGKERVVWRFDPLVLTDRIDSRQLIGKVSRVAELLSGFTEKLIFSFADIESYRKVKRNLKAEGVRYRNFSADDVSAIAGALSGLGKKHHMDVCSCAEKYDLSNFGIKKSRCIDGELMMRVFPDDRDLIQFLNPRNSLFPTDSFKPDWNAWKDKGQRALCGCLVSKDIGRYDTCKHLCVYCYANASPGKVMENFNRNISCDAESLLTMK